MSRAGAVLLAAVGFGAGFAATALLGGGERTRSVSPPGARLGHASESRHGEAPRSVEEHGVEGDGPAAGSSSDDGAPLPRLPAPLADPERHVRYLVAAAVRKELGEVLPSDAWEAAVRGAKETMAASPAGWGRTFAQREKLRRRFGELGDPWEVVLQARTKFARELNVSDLVAEKPRFRLAAAPLSVDRAVGSDERDSVWGRSAVAPLGRTLVLESVDVRGVFGTAETPVGEVTVTFAGTSLPTVRSQGPARFRLAGVAQAWGATGFESRDAGVTVAGAAVEVVLRGRLASGDAADRVAASAFRIVSGDGSAPFSGAPVRLQVVAEHGGGNPNTLHLDGSTNGRIGVLSDRPVWDDALDVRSLRGSVAFSSGAGPVPAGKAFRVRRVEWRVRFPEPKSSSEFGVLVAGETVVRIRGSELEEEWERERKAEKSAGKERSGEASREVTRAGVWTGDALVRPGQESRTSLTCAYYVMGEAVLHGELVDEPR